MSRRESLKWLGLIAAGSAVALSAGCSKVIEDGKDAIGHWPDLKLDPITSKGYGTDPNLVIPPESPWPLTLTNEQLSLVALLSDYIVPKEGEFPCATELHVPAVVDEWVSAPYEGQQRDRLKILNSLAWINHESERRFKKPYLSLNPQQHCEILDDITYFNEKTPPQFQRIAKTFERFKELVLAAYFCSPEGCKDIGYLGNVPIAGDYPGPTQEAKQHLDSILAELGLSQFAYSD